MKVLGPTLDENRADVQVAHEIRSSKTLRAKAVYALRGDCRWAVTGTVIQNRWEDLISLLKFLKCYPDNALSFGIDRLKPDVNNPYLRTLLANICLRRPKTAIDLPHREDKVHRVEFEVDEANHYNDISQAVSASLNQTGDTNLSRYSNVLAKINSLRQVCNLGRRYRGPTDTQQETQSHSAMFQDLFEGMLSAGVVKCSICRRDLMQGNLNNESLLGATESYESSQPRLAACGEIVCAICSTRLEATGDVKAFTCRHQPPCEFIHVRPSASAEPNLDLSLLQFPTKIRAFQHDVFSLPHSEKR